MTESRHTVELEVKWAVALMLIVVLPLALYAGVEIGLNQVNNLFPTASVSCH